MILHETTVKKFHKALSGFTKEEIHGWVYTDPKMETAMWKRLLYRLLKKAGRVVKLGQLHMYNYIYATIKLILI